MAQVVVAGGGVGGITVANRLARSNVDVALLDGHGDHIYQPGLVYLPFREGSKPKVRFTRRLLDDRVRLHIDRVVGVEPNARHIELQSGGRLSYDALVLATGARLDPRRIPGFREGALHFHCARRVVTLRERLASFRGGRIVVGAARLPYKCPPAPGGFPLLLEDRLRRDGRLPACSLHFVYPTPDLGGSQEVDAALTRMLRARGYTIHRPFETTSVDPEARTLASLSGEILPYDLLVMVPPHTASPYVSDSGLAGPDGWLTPDPTTLRLRGGIYALGDATDLRAPMWGAAPKLGSAAHAQGRIVARNIEDELEGREPNARYDGRGLCVAETGRRRGILLRSSYARPARVTKPSPLHAASKRMFGKLYFRLLARG